MRRLSLIAIFGAVLICMWGLSAPALADPIIEVVPLDYDFGDVQVGSSSTAIITITNTNGEFLEIYSVTLSGSPDFSIIMAPPPDTKLATGESADVAVAFTPSATGYVTAVMDIASNDMGSPIVPVSLAGMGVGQEEPPVSVTDILAFFDASVADGTLYGDGPGRSADVRWKALRNMIEAAGDLIDGGYTDTACGQLLDAYQRCDGLPRPPEFVAGPATPELAQMILDLMGALGC